MTDSINRRAFLLGSASVMVAAKIPGGAAETVQVMPPVYAYRDRLAFVQWSRVIDHQALQLWEISNMLIEPLGGPR